MSIKVNRALYQLKRENRGRTRGDALNGFDIRKIFTTVPQSGGGEFFAQRINEITDGSTYTLPLADSVPVETLIGISLPETYKAQTPTINRTGTNTITSSAGTDTGITYDATEWGLIWLTSNGTNSWII